MQFVIGQQFHAARKILLQDAQRKLEPGVLVGGDVVQRLLEREPVERLRAVGVQIVQNAAQALFAGWRLQVGVMLHLADHRYRRAGGIGADDQADAVGQLGVRD